MQEKIPKRRIDSIYTDLGKKLGISASEMELIDKSQFALIADMMKSMNPNEDYYPCAKIPYFGSVRVRDSIQQKLNKKYETTRDKSDNLGSGDSSRGRSTGSIPNSDK